MNHNLSIHDLNNDVLLLMLEKLGTIDRNSFLSLCLVSKLFYSLSVPFIYRDVFPPPWKDGRSLQLISERLLETLSRPDSILPSFVRRITLPGHDTHTSKLIELLPKFTRLENLVWGKVPGWGSATTLRIPSELLQALEDTHPKAKLVVHSSFPWQGSSPTELQNISSPFLDAFHCNLTYEPECQRLGKLCLFETIKSSLNLRKLHASTYSGGCVMYGWDPSNPPMEVSFDITPETRLPRLEELRLSRSPFKAHELSTWGSYGGWEKLKRLSLDDISYLTAFLGRVPNLQKLRVDRSTWSQLQESCINDLEARLQELRLEGKDMKIPFDLLEKHSSSLTKLYLHAPEPYGDAKRADIDSKDLERLLVVCPNLTKLAIDMNRDGEWPYDFLKSVAKFPKLIHLELLAEGLGGRPDPVEPILDKASARYLFELLRGHKEGVPLQRLKIQRGGMAPHVFGYPGPDVIDEQSYRAIFDCRFFAGETLVQQIGGEDFVSNKSLDILLDELELELLTTRDST